MIKSMTGFSKAEATGEGVKATIELKSLNGRYLEINCKMPRNLQSKELEVREMLRSTLSRGTVSVSINIELSENVRQFKLNEKIAGECNDSLNELRKALKIKEAVKLDHILTFSSYFLEKEADENDEEQFAIVAKALREAVKTLDKMRTQEGLQISKDIFARMKKIETAVDKIDDLGAERIPQEREKLHQRIAQLFESDEIDEQRLQMEMVIMADKLDISEECVRLRSHFKFFHDTMKALEPMGRKINFLLQEMNREINTIGSKVNDAKISQYVVNVKEELERIREQIQNIE